MPDTYLIKNTANNSSANFTIKPGALDGPGGTSQHSDLRLYGLGSSSWGEGTNENLYRILESSACPQKEAGDYYAPRDAYDYDPNVDPILPKSEHDIAPGHGITYPVIGQLWFNTDQEVIYTYTSLGWESAINGSYLVADGSIPMTGDLDLNGFTGVNVRDPLSDLEVANKKYVDDQTKAITDTRMTVVFDATGTILSSTNIVSVARNSVGLFTITFADVGTTSYNVTGSGDHPSDSVIFTPRAFSTNSVQVFFYRWDHLFTGSSSGPYDPPHASVTITL